MTPFDRFCLRMAAWFSFLMWLIWVLEKVLEEVGK